MKDLHKKSTLEGEKKPAPSGKPVKPKKPPPAEKETVKIPVPCLTEKRIREIAREEIFKWAKETSQQVRMSRP